MDRTLSPSSASEWNSSPQTSDIPDEWNRLAIEESSEAIKRLQSVSPCHTNESEIEEILNLLEPAGPQVLVSFFQPPAPMSRFEQLATTLWERVHQKETDRGKSCALIYSGLPQLPAQSNRGVKVLLSVIGQLLQLNEILGDEQGDSSRWKWLKDEEYRNFDQFITNYTDVRNMLYRLLEEVQEKFTLYVFLESYSLNLDRYSLSQDELQVLDGIRGVLRLPQKLKGKKCATVKVFAALPEGIEAILDDIKHDRLRVLEGRPEQDRPEGEPEGGRDPPNEALPVWGQGECLGPWRVYFSF